MSMSDQYFEPYAKAAYEAYKESTGGKTFDGRDMPTWEEIGIKTPHVQRAWVASVKSTMRILGVQDHEHGRWVDTTREQELKDIELQDLALKEHQRDLAARHIILEGKEPE